MQALIDTLARLPVEWFVLIGSIIEEVISPIPSFLVLVPGGASVEAHHMHIAYTIVLALLAALGRVIGASFLYWLAGTLRGRLFTGNKKRFGVTRADIERLKERLGNRKSWWMIFIMWAIPILPGAPLSLGSGFIKVPWVIFVTATFFGSVINALFYLLVGYYGLKAVHTLKAVETAGEIAGCLFIAALLVWFIVWRVHAGRAAGKKKI